MTQTDCEKIAL